MQESKQKTLIEDYAYKKMLVNSIIGFSEEFKKEKTSIRLSNGTTTNPYSFFLERTLSQLLQDPLRSRKALIKELAKLEKKDNPKPI